MKKTEMIFIVMLVVFLFSGLGLAQDPIVFPAKGQSQDQMEKDKFSCYQWARNDTGFDPMQTPIASTPPPQQQARQGGALAGAAVGAGAGALINRSDRGRGAATGALVGGVLGGARQSQANRQDQQARQQWEHQQANEYAQKRNTYNRAFSACMESKGYTVR